ncbi:hypothetical protein R1flu_000263 [Riccia fluitans]|uniref:Uncharacterized protein n=1 Tax=Riccia fluitans TaxID=41844 RepID=A0ABD1Y064_9MARC
MVARLKLKGIDGRAPPGVEPAAELIQDGETYQVFTKARVFFKNCPNDLGMMGSLILTAKKYYSLNAQIVCDDKKRIIFWYAWFMCRFNLSSKIFLI